MLSRQGRARIRTGSFMRRLLYCVTGAHACAALPMPCSVDCLQHGAMACATHPFPACVPAWGMNVVLVVRAQHDACPGIALDAQR